MFIQSLILEYLCNFTNLNKKNYKNKYTLMLYKSDEFWTDILHYFINGFLLSEKRYRNTSDLTPSIGGYVLKVHE